MRRRPLCLLLLPLFAGLVAAQDKGPALAEGRDLPGTFHPYNINARAIPLDDPEPKGKRLDLPPPSTKGKFHCLISEYNLDPVVMIFARGVEDNKAFQSSLKALDAAIEKQPALRLRTFVVFLDKGLAKVMDEDDNREKLVARIEAAFASWSPKHIVLTLAGTDDVAKFDLDATTPVTAVLYHKLRVKAVHKLNKDDLAKEDSAGIQKLLNDVYDKLGARALAPAAKPKG